MKKYKSERARDTAMMPSSDRNALNTKTPLEIYGEHFSRMNPDGGEYRTDEDIENAMEEYAERQATRFANWCMEQQAKSQGYNYSHTANGDSYKLWKTKKI